MTDNDWITPKKEYKKKNSEETFYLSEILLNGGCMRCINDRCDFSREHGSFFPDKLCTFVKNPTYIEEIKKSIDSAKLNFDNKKAYFSVCNYVNSNCRNCEEGRITYIKVNNKDVALCYPIFNKNKQKITIGVHIDIKLILKGNRYIVSSIPINMDRYKKIDIVPQVKDKSIDTVSQVKDKLIDTVPHIEDKSIDLLAEKWEKITDSKQVEYTEPLNYLKIKDSFKNSSMIFQEKVKSENPVEKIKTKVSLLKNNTSNKDLNYETEYLDNGNRFLEDSYIENIFNYNNIDEINYLNTRVTKQFFDTEYSRYLIF